MTPSPRAGGCLLAAVVLSLMVSACAPKPDGLVGVTVDSAGQIRGLVRTCQHPLDGVTLLSSNVPSGVDSDQSAIAEWVPVQDPSSTTISWAILGSAGPAVETRRQIDELPDEPLSMFGWTQSGSTMAEYVYFDPSDLRDLLPGSVIVGEGNIVSTEEFERQACQAGK